MFDLGASEMLLVLIVAIVVIGPKDLPLAMRVTGKWVGKARGVMRQFRSTFDDMVREAEMEELEKKWRDQNEAIMREFPRVTDPDDAATLAAAIEPVHPLPEPAPPTDRADSPTEASAETHVVPPEDGPLP